MLKALIAAQIRLVDARFLYRQGLPATVGARALKYPAIAFERLSQRYSAEYQELLFERFSVLNSLHYAPDGRGYRTLAGQSPEDRAMRYWTQTSRLEYFSDRFPDLLGYVDGDHFLDLGCGTGQNIRFLASRFPGSRITGTDLNADAVALVSECEAHPRLELTVGDIHDDHFLDGVLSQGVDHVVLSHVFGLIIGRSHRETRLLRQRVLDRLAKSSRKSIIIIDTFGSRGCMEISVEQRQRAFVTDDVLSYFSAHTDGRAVQVQSDRTEAIVFFKNSWNSPGP